MSDWRPDREHGDARGDDGNPDVREGNREQPQLEDSGQAEISRHRRGLHVSRAGLAAVIVAAAAAGAAITVVADAVLQGGEGRSTSSQDGALVEGGGGDDQGEAGTSEPDVETEVVIPDVEGLSIAAAARRLADAGLTMGGYSREPTDEAPSGSILDTDPPAGTSVADGTAVDVTVAENGAGPSDEGDGEADQDLTYSIVEETFQPVDVFGNRDNEVAWAVALEPSTEEVGLEAIEVQVNFRDAEGGLVGTDRTSREAPRAHPETGLVYVGNRADEVADADSMEVELFGAGQESSWDNLDAQCGARWKVNSATLEGRDVIAEAEPDGWEVTSGEVLAKLWIAGLDEQGDLVAVDTVTSELHSEQETLTVQGSVRILNNVSYTDTLADVSPWLCHASS